MNKPVPHLKEIKKISNTIHNIRKRLIAKSELKQLENQDWTYYVFFDLIYKNIIVKH